MKLSEDLILSLAEPSPNAQVDLVYGGQVAWHYQIDTKIHRMHQKQHSAVATRAKDGSEMKQQNLEGLKKTRPWFVEEEPTAL